MQLEVPNTPPARTSLPSHDCQSCPQIEPPSDPLPLPVQAWQTLADSYGGEDPRLGTAVGAPLLRSPLGGGVEPGSRSHSNLFATMTRPLTGTGTRAPAGSGGSGAVAGVGGLAGTAVVGGVGSGPAGAGAGLATTSLPTLEPPMDRRFSRVAAAIDTTVKSCGFSKVRLAFACPAPAPGSSETS